MLTLRSAMLFSCSRSCLQMMGGASTLTQTNTTVLPEGTARGNHNSCSERTSHADVLLCCNRSHTYQFFELLHWERCSQLLAQAGPECMA